MIGAGTAGLAAFHEVRRAGRSALLIDHGPLGTTCARTGCMPSKAVLHPTGSRPIVPDFLRALGDCVLTTDTLFQRKRPPRSIGIIGAGAVGLEMAVALSRLGVRVVAADLKEWPGGIQDPAVAQRAIDSLREEFSLWLGQPVEVRAGPSGAEIASGQQAELVEVVPGALGRRPNVELLNRSDARPAGSLRRGCDHLATAGQLRVPGR